jgi:hypothetical protein
MSLPTRSLFGSPALQGLFGAPKAHDHQDQRRPHTAVHDMAIYNADAVRGPAHTAGGGGFAPEAQGRAQHRRQPAMNEDAWRAGEPPPRRRSSTPMSHANDPEEGEEEGRRAAAPSRATAAARGVGSSVEGETAPPGKREGEGRRVNGRGGSGGGGGGAPAEGPPPSRAATAEPVPLIAPSRRIVSSASGIRGALATTVALAVTAAVAAPPPPSADAEAAAAARLALSTATEAHAEAERALRARCADLEASLAAARSALEAETARRVAAEGIVEERLVAAEEAMRDWRDALESWVANRAQVDAAASSKAFADRAREVRRDLQNEVRRRAAGHDARVNALEAKLRALGGASLPEVLSRAGATLLAFLWNGLLVLVTLLSRAGGVRSVVPALLKLGGSREGSKHKVPGSTDGQPGRGEGEAAGAGASEDAVAPSQENFARGPRAQRRQVAAIRESESLVTGTAYVSRLPPVTGSLSYGSTPGTPLKPRLGGAAGSSE